MQTVFFQQPVNVAEISVQRLFASGAVAAQQQDAEFAGIYRFHSLQTEFVVRTFLHPAAKRHATAKVVIVAEQPPGGFAGNRIVGGILQPRSHHRFQFPFIVRCCHHFSDRFISRGKRSRRIVSLLQIRRQKPDDSSAFSGIKQTDLSEIGIKGVIVLRFQQPGSFQQGKNLLFQRRVA